MTEYGNMVVRSSIKTYLEPQDEESMYRSVLHDFEKNKKKHNWPADATLSYVAYPPTKQRQAVVIETGEPYTEDYVEYALPDGVEMRWLGKWLHMRGWFYVSE
jgi:hypothetical protein